MAVTACYNAINFKYIKAWKRIGGVEGRILSGKMCSDHKLAFGLLERYNWPTFECMLSSVYKLIFSSMILQHVKFPLFFSSVKLFISHSHPYASKKRNLWAV